jgi:hypothetical protein
MYRLPVSVAIWSDYNSNILDNAVETAGLSAPVPESGLPRDGMTIPEEPGPTLLQVRARRLGHPPVDSGGSIPFGAQSTSSAGYWPCACHNRSGLGWDWELDLYCTVAMIMLLATAAWAGNQASVHTFCSQPACADGAYPYAGMIFDSAGNL